MRTQLRAELTRWIRSGEPLTNGHPARLYYRPARPGLAPSFRVLHQSLPSFGDPGEPDPGVCRRIEAGDWRLARREPLPLDRTVEGLLHDLEPVVGRLPLHSERQHQQEDLFGSGGDLPLLQS